jgi:hypothetical protein
MLAFCAPEASFAKQKTRYPLPSLVSIITITQTHPLPVRISVNASCHPAFNPGRDKFNSQELFMLNKTLAALLVTGGLFAATAAQADHNSVWGPGTANMPNDIHNSAIEDDQDVFLDLVQQGGGADSVNRYDDDTTTVTDTTDRSDRTDVSTRRTVDRSATDTRSASRSMARSSMTTTRSGGGSRR